MRRLVLTAALACVTMSASPAFAQYENRALSDRLDRMERDLQMMQSQMARGSGGPVVIQSPALGGGATTTRSAGEGATVSPGMASRLDDRINQLEDLVRQLTGRVEEATYKANQAQKQMERMQADIDLRFKDLQAQGQGAAAAPAPQPQSALSMPAAGGATAKGADVPGPATGPQTLGTLSEKDMKRLAPAAAAATPQSLYDGAFEALQGGDYATAERGFQDFLSKYSDNQLAANAQYWLGHIAYVRKDFSSSAALFLEGYKKYPKHSKAPDMIYKAGSAFGQMGKTKEACTAFGILFSEQPKMSDSVRRAATAEKQKYNCK